MFRALKSHALTWLAIGLVGGFSLGLLYGGYWPQTPLHAVATDRIDTFAIATGPVDDDAEAVFFLDFLTGDLRAVVISKMSGKFSAFYSYNVLNDMQVDPSKNPRFLMVTGMMNLRRGAAHVSPSKSVVYVAEVTTGKVAAYSLPWSPAVHATGATVRATFQPLDVTRFRAAAGPAVGGVGTPK